MSTHTPHPDLPPPSTSVGLIGWLRANLFSSWPNSLLTIAAIYVLFIALPPLIEWAFLKASWLGDSRAPCDAEKGGACWVFVKVRMDQFMYGLYPESEYWRINLAFAILAEAALSFFGLGTQPPDASWGRMLSEGRAYFRQSIWLGVFPGLAIMLTVMGFNFLGDGLRDVLDPRMRDR